MHWYLEAFRNYFNFSGRATRPEFWYFYLFHLLAIFFLSIFDGAMGLMLNGSSLGLLAGFYALASFIPSVSVSVRRLHDADFSGGWAFLMLIPFVSIVLLFLWARKGTEGENRFGPASGNPAPVVGEVLDARAGS